MQQMQLLATLFLQTAMPSRQRTSSRQHLQTDLGPLGGLGVEGVAQLLPRLGGLLQPVDELFVNVFMNECPGDEKEMSNKCFMPECP